MGWNDSWSASPEVWTVKRPTVADILTDKTVGTVSLPVPVTVEAKLFFVEPGRRWAHSPSPSKAPGISYQGTMKTSVRMVKTSGGF